MPVVSYPIRESQPSSQNSASFIPGGRIILGAGKLLFRGYRAYRRGRQAGRCILYFYCFVAGTDVATVDGPCDIEDVSVGDLVRSYDHASESWTLNEVIETFEREYSGEMVTVEIAVDLDGDGAFDPSLDMVETFECTAGHALWVTTGADLESRPRVRELPRPESAITPAGRWVEAKHLRLGDHFLTRTGKSATVAGLTIRIERVKVYNLNVAENHNYAVAESGALGHNRCHRHHMVPRQILKGLPGHLKNHPLIRGRRGHPNRWSIPEEIHREIHRGKGWGRGGKYNGRWREELEDLLIRKPNKRKWTVDDIERIRERLAEEFDLGKFRPDTWQF